MSRFNKDRRRLIGLGVIFAAAISKASHAEAAGPPEVNAYKDPGCGCCQKWALGLQADGFNVTMTEDPDLAKRRAAAGVPPELAGCHTAFVDGYVIEGHVPSDDVVRLLNEKPAALGLAVAGMPLGSPGMETAGAKDAYDVMLFMADGTSKVFASH